MDDDSHQMSDSERREIDVSQLLHSTPGLTRQPFVALDRSLPLQNMSPDDFECMCARLIEATYGHVIQAFRYGAFPQAQEGIDIVATSRHSRKKITAECKRVQEVKAGAIRQWTDRFIARADLATIDRFILAMTVNMEASNKRIDEWTEFLARIDAHGITCEIWDYSRIEQLLRKQPDIVAIFFGPEAADRFCVQVTLSDRWPTEFKARFEHYDSNRNYVLLEDKYVQLSLFVPSERSPSVSAALSFARHDLRGLSVSIAGRTIVNWMQWLANADSAGELPFLLKGHTRTSGSFRRPECGCC